MKERPENGEKKQMFFNPFSGLFFCLFYFFILFEVSGYR